MAASTDMRAAILRLAGNLSATHREHEKHYGEAPLERASTLLRHSRTLKALAEHWTSADPADAPLPSPYAGAEDLNDPRAVETSGLLFLESGDPPPELTALLDELERMAAEAEATGAWLSEAMNASWETAAGLLAVPELDDLLAERHGIIARDAQTATLLRWQARQLRRAVEILGHVDFSAAALRADLAGERRVPGLLFAAAEMIDAAVNLCTQGATLIRQNERPWRLFHDRVAEISTAG
jgi:hypothetical protein